MIKVESMFLLVLIQTLKATNYTIQIMVRSSILEMRSLMKMKHGIVAPRYEVAFQRNFEETIILVCLNYMRRGMRCTIHFVGLRWCSFRDYQIYIPSSNLVVVEANVDIMALGLSTRMSFLLIGLFIWFLALFYPNLTQSFVKI